MRALPESIPEGMLEGMLESMLNMAVVPDDFVNFSGTCQLIFELFRHFQHLAKMSTLQLKCNKFNQVDHTRFL